MYKALLAAALTVASFCASAESFDASTDPTTQEVLAHPFHKIWDGVRPGEHYYNYALHRNFPGLIEYGWAQKTPEQAAAFVDSLSEHELTELGALYVVAAYETGHTPRLARLMADRLDAHRLSKLARGFGADFFTADIKDAQKLYAFQAEAGGIVMATPWGMLGQFLYNTPQEIYQTFRAAPYSMNPTGALFESASPIGLGIWVGWTAGTDAGTVLAGLIQQNDPDLWDAIGGTVAQMVDNFVNVYNLDGIVKAGQVQQQMNGPFELNQTQMGDMSNFGGDYTAAQPQQTFVGSSCAHTPRSACGPYQQH
ncbi:MAG: hypothetical protein JSR59_26815 [Proteobacteria bacterium]|nr:hypothetical protein [Pseudomonadota bacterium]